MLDLMLRLVLGGGVLVGALLALRWAQARGMTARGGPELRVVGRTGLTRQALVAVVAVDQRRFLVGAGDQGVALLAELEPLPPPGGDASEEPTLLLDPPTTAAPPTDVLATDALPADVAAAVALGPTLGTHGRGAPSNGPRIGPMDRLRAMTVRTHPGEPIRAHQSG